MIKKYPRDLVGYGSKTLKIKLGFTCCFDKSF